MLTAPPSTPNTHTAGVTTLAPEIVEAVKPSTWQTDSGEQRTTYWIKLVNETGERELPCYDPRGADLKTDAELPEGWEVKTSKAGKLYLAAPKASGGGGWAGKGQAAWANTEAGQRWNDERVDRRRAMELAIAFLQLAAAKHDTGEISAALRDTVAEDIFAWLRKNLDVSVSSDSSKGRDAAKADTPLDEGGVEPGEASSPSSTNCIICGKEWGPAKTGSGKRVCVAGHVERFG